MAEESGGPKIRERGKYYFQYSRHLNSLLITDKIDLYRKYPDALSQRFPHLQHNWFVELGQGVARGRIVLSWLQENIENSFLNPTGECSDTWTRNRDITLLSIQTQIEHITKDLSHADSKESTRVLLKILKDPVIIHRAYQKINIMNFHNKINEKALLKEDVFELKLGVTMEFTGDLVVLKDYPGGPVVITYPMLLSVLDKIEAHFSWEYCLSYVDNLPANKNKDYKTLFMKLYEILETNYKRHGNEAVRLFKLLEPLMVGVSLQHLPEDTNV